jgi:hypothetical protein
MMPDGRIERSNSTTCITLFAFASLLFFFGSWQWYTTEESSFKIFGSDTRLHVSDQIYDDTTKDENNVDTLKILIEEGVYCDRDFVNEIGVTPPYWNNATLQSPKETTTEQWGPCFGTHEHVEWGIEIEIEKNRSRKIPFYPKQGVGIEKNDWANYCRPGFLIIGAGKCGTSVRVNDCLIFESNTGSDWVPLS